MKKSTERRRVNDDKGHSQNMEGTHKHLKNLKIVRGDGKVSINGRTITLTRTGTTSASATKTESAEKSTIVD